MFRARGIALSLFAVLLLATVGLGLGTSDVDGATIEGASALDSEDARATVVAPSSVGVCEPGEALPQISSPVPTADAPRLPGSHFHCFLHCFTVTFNGTHVWVNCHPVCDQFV